MATDDDVQLKRKVDDLLRRSDVATSGRQKVLGHVEAAREQLTALFEEARAAGVDPRNLVAERDKARAELEAAAAAFEAELVSVEAALAEVKEK